MFRRMTLLVLALALWMAAPAAQAADVGAGMGAAVDFSRYNVDLDFDGGPTSGADIDEIGLTLSEQVAPALELALQGGYTSVDPGNHPAAASFGLTGRFFGVVARSQPRLGGNFSLLLQAAYRYHKVDNGQSEGQFDEFTWYETALRAGPAFRRGPVEVIVGGYYQHFDGSEHARGPIAFSRDFGADSASGAFASVVYYIDPTGKVGLFGTTGGRHGFGVIFSRSF